MSLSVEKIEILAEGAGRAAFEITQILAAACVGLEDDAPKQAKAWFFEVATTLENAIPALDGILADLQNADENSLDELFDEISEIGSDLADLHTALWYAPFEENTFELRLLLIHLVALPLFALLHVLQEATLLHLDPWVVCDDPEEPDMDFVLQYSAIEGKNILAIVHKKFPLFVPENFSALARLFSA